MIKRRQFIAGLGSAAAWPVVARAQQPAVPVIGWLSGRNAETDALLLPAFRQGLNMHGYVESQNLTIEYRYAEGQFDRVPSLIADLVNRPVAAIVTVGSDPGQGVPRLKVATTTIPIVFNTGLDPVAVGFVASLGRPGGNVTGVTSFLYQLGTKRLGLLRELAPSAATIAVLRNPLSPSAELAEVQDAARALGQSCPSAPPMNWRPYLRAYPALGSMHSSLPPIRSSSYAPTKSSPTRRAMRYPLSISGASSPPLAG
jgi:putative tryptophan/tyrosine transport system substrate-binding protein